MTKYLPQFPKTLLPSQPLQPQKNKTLLVSDNGQKLLPLLIDNGFVDTEDNIAEQWYNTYFYNFPNVGLGTTNQIPIPQGLYQLADVSVHFNITMTGGAAASPSYVGFALINQFSVQYPGYSQQIQLSGIGNFYKCLEQCTEQQKPGMLAQAGGTASLAAGTYDVYVPLSIDPFSSLVDSKHTWAFDSTALISPINIAIQLSTLAQMPSVGAAAVGLAINTARLVVRTARRINPMDDEPPIYISKFCQDNTQTGTLQFNTATPALALAGFRPATCVGILIAAIDQAPNNALLTNKLTNLQLLYQGNPLIQLNGDEYGMVRQQVRSATNYIAAPLPAAINAVGTNYWYFLPFSSQFCMEANSINKLQSGYNFSGQTLNLSFTSASANPQTLVYMYFYNAVYRLESGNMYIDF